MEELDLLLEELALNSARSDSAIENKSSDAAGGEVPGAVNAGHTKNGTSSVSSSVYSHPPAPVAASLEPQSPTLELESILQDLLSLGQENPAPPATPPPLTQKQSGKKKTEGEQQQGSSSAADSKASTQTKKTDTIDDLLGGLSSDLEKIGVRTTAKGHCASCNKCIVGKMITALGEVWHPEHFVCVACKMELSGTGFFERDGRPYCEKDYYQLFSPQCAYCKGPIIQNILTALDQTWHPEHFFCTHCGGLFDEDGYLVKDGKPYCCKDFYHLFAPKCSGCGESVRGNYLTAANGTWHPECFVCADCLMPFPDGSFMVLDERPLCSLHYHTRQGTLCGSCCEPIMGPCISALNRKFHPEHFVCAFCLKQLKQGVVKEQKGKPYCSACFGKLFV
ncbi:leupaxin [Mugil cephalus]|uniref:leupaxin n=1 Tax=Mugil cephalus TaxID=48193 RepID=UPI001FB81FE6|nr:leupaxin [Mugil cephalus]